MMAKKVFMKSPQSEDFNFPEVTVTALHISQRIRITHVYIYIAIMYVDVLWLWCAKKTILVGVREENAKDMVGWKQMTFTILIC